MLTFSVKVSESQKFATEFLCSALTGSRPEGTSRSVYLSGTCNQSTP
jgi:hypothetical protein